MNPRFIVYAVYFTLPFYEKRLVFKFHITTYEFDDRYFSMSEILLSQTLGSFISDFYGVPLYCKYKSLIVVFPVTVKYSVNPSLPKCFDGIPISVSIGIEALI